MTCHTLAGCAFIYSVLVTLLAFHFGMFPFERETGLVVVEGSVAPSIGRVTGTAIGAELTIVFVFRGMTGITVGRRAFVAVGMTCLALYSGVFAVEREAGIVVVEVHVRPAGGLMARAAIRAELPVVLIPTGVTGITVRGRPFEHTIGMTILARYARMRACERETRLAVIEGGVLPTVGVMTSGTDRAELSVMSVVGGVTSHALSRCTFVLAVHMAGGTRHTAVRAGKREARAAVVEIHVLPGGRVMAGGTIRAELTVMLVIRRVTGKTVGRRPLESSVGMAGGAGGSLVSANQLETRLAVIEMHILPVEGIMALGAVHAHLPLVNIHMTGHTGSRRIFESQIGMAFGTGNIHMPAHQRKCRLRMVKRDILPGGRLVAGGAVRPQRPFMGVILSMTGETIRRRPFEEKVAVTCLTGNVGVRFSEFEG